ncbi:unknown protein [Microcystis aeruginosa NIES-843]|uniref:Uncharacterized protein n=1 Tax=Microcystis aeruginosa (strain NIES-843 / IAM M-2473) TaxID=449447 RepID=B0JXS1_MICAN|nr:unknown protein [Microcystis aeruginosa NIES-843]
MVRRNGQTTATKTDRCIGLGNQQRQKLLLLVVNFIMTRLNVIAVILLIKL